MRINRPKALILPPDQFHPRQLFLRENISCRGEVFRVVEARCCDIDFVRPLRMLISQGTPAVAAECSPRTRFRSIPARITPAEVKVGTLNCDPRDSLRADCTSAILAMAVCSVERSRSGAEADFSTVTAARNWSFVHQCRVSKFSAGRCRTSTPRVWSDRQRHRLRTAHSVPFFVSLLSAK
jgi:hypothetical protein